MNQAAKKTNPVGHPPSWDRHREQLEKDILSGVFGLNGLLPLKKELQARYGVCFRTLRKILATLEGNGLIRAKGKGYALPEIGSGKKRNRIIFITVLDHFEQESALCKEQSRIVTSFESECTRLGLYLEMMEIDFADSAATFRGISKIAQNDDTVIGFIFDLWWYPQQPFRDSQIAALTRIAPFRKPIAILDELGHFALPFPFTQDPLIQVYTIEGAQAGERMATFLLGLGHTSIGYISVTPLAEWSTARLEGIKKQCERAGYGGNVFALEYQGTDTGIHGLLTASGLSDSDVKSLIAVGRTPSQQKGLESQWLEFKKNNNPPYQDCVKLGPSLKKNLVNLAANIRRGSDPDFIQEACKAAMRTVANQAFTVGLVPLFKKALKCRKVTAWICASDMIAFQALAFLHSRNIQVPKDLSVAGFDNWPVQAFRQKLTTLDFNAMGFVNSMLNFVLRPPRPRRPYQHNRIEIEGIIMERGTTARVKH